MLGAINLVPFFCLKFKIDMKKEINRKEFPMYRGLRKYFPDALFEVSNVSFRATQQHHPNKEMHWNKEVSNDHLDCLERHLNDHAKGIKFDEDGSRHLAKVVWRALGALQIELEEEKL